jgi:hypothetical protein|tara:strand:+ start:243 stop:566 length:324 start_codon:yes stop_codon:yes gene_type:complete
MPTYDILNTETNEVEEVFMTISGKEKYLKDNPHLKQHHTKVAGIVRSSGTTNVDNHGFKEVLQKVGEGHPMGTVADDHVRLTGKEAKTRDVVKKHAKIQADRKTRIK